MCEDNGIKKILTDCKNIVIVGASRDSSKASYIVSRYLKEHGYKIIPVNPFASNILGEKAYHSLSEIKEPVDLVDIFRSVSEVYVIVKETIKLKPKVIWMQLGIKSIEASKLAEKNNITAIMDRCIMAEHKRLF
jgi:predicted CoA-binding protein